MHKTEIPQVKESSVNVNDILIKGSIEGKYTGIQNMHLHAEGDIQAKIKYSHKLKVYL